MSGKALKRLTWPRGLAVAALLMLVLIGAQPLWANAPVHVRDGDVRLVDGVYVLDAQIEYRLSGAAEEALDSGVPLVILLEIEVERTRWWWWNAEVARLEQRYRLRYHALAERYVLTALNSGESRSFRNLHVLLEELGTVEGLPVIDAGLLDDDENYRVRLRAGVDLDALPLPLRTVAYISPAWSLTSEWRSWSLDS